MTLSDTQLEAIEEAAKILAAAGLSFSDLSDSQPSNLGLNVSHLHTFDELQSSSPPSSTLSSVYEPPRARMFTLDELESRACGSRLNRQASVNGIIDHALGSIVEYPETGAQHGECIAHRFAVDPKDFTNPKANMQYSLGDDHGGRKEAQCYLLTSQNGEPVPCSHLRTSCELYYKNDVVH